MLRERLGLGRNEAGQTTLRRRGFLKVAGAGLGLVLANEVRNLVDMMEAVKAEGPRWDFPEGWTEADTWIVREWIERINPKAREVGATIRASDKLEDGGVTAVSLPSGYWKMEYAEGMKPEEAVVAWGVGYKKISGADEVAKKIVRMRTGSRPERGVEMARAVEMPVVVEEERVSEGTEVAEEVFVLANVTVVPKDRVKFGFWGGIQVPIKEMEEELGRIGIKEAVVHFAKKSKPAAYVGVIGRDDEGMEHVMFPNDYGDDWDGLSYKERQKAVFARMVALRRNGQYDYVDTRAWSPFGVEGLETGPVRGELLGEGDGEMTTREWVNKLEGAYQSGAARAERLANDASEKVAEADKRDYKQARGAQTSTLAGIVGAGVIAALVIANGAKDREQRVASLAAEAVVRTRDRQ